jgi:hypothetical protein
MRACVCVFLCLSVQFCACVRLHVYGACSLCGCVCVCVVKADGEISVTWEELSFCVRIIQAVTFYS